MTLAELAFACFVLGTIDKGEYEELLSETDGHPEPSLSQHQLKILKWLNGWGCRHIAKEFHELAAEEITSWYQKYGHQLFDRNRNLHDLSKDELAFIGLIYEDLSGRTVAYRGHRRSGDLIKVKFGPTATAKFLFAIRPRALMPWDASIKKEWGYDESAESYVNFLIKVQEAIRELETSCKQYGFELAELPQKLGKPNSTIPKLIDEYFWVTITKKCKPSREDFQRWAEWSG